MAIDLKEIKKLVYSAEPNAIHDNTQIYEWTNGKNQCIIKYTDEEIIKGTLNIKNEVECTGTQSEIIDHSCDIQLFIVYSMSRRKLQRQTGHIIIDDLKIRSKSLKKRKPELCKQKLINFLIKNTMYLKIY